MRDQTTIPLADRAAAVDEYLQSIGNPDVTAVNFECYCPGGITVQIHERVPEVPWITDGSAYHPYVFVEYAGVRMRVVTADRKGLDNA